MYRVFDTVDEVSRYSAQRLLNRIQIQPDTTLGLATGSTMEPVYKHLLTLLQRTPVSLSRVTTFNLDEYIGLDEAHPQSYCYYMHQHLFNKMGLPRERINLPDGTASDTAGACDAYSQAIRTRGGLNLQLLGIGSNGHIGFNEPDTCFSSRTHVVELSPQTRRDNGRFFTDPNDIPTHAITLGIQDILEAKEILLIATGRHKADIIARLFHSSIDERLPASALKQHDNVTIVLDSEAAALLPQSQCFTPQTS